MCNYVRWTPGTDLFTTIDGTTKSYATPQQYEGESCRLYRNEGGGVPFTDISEEAGVRNPEGKSLGVAVTDFNGDGWPDLAVANDTQRNFLYRNDGDGTFTDIGGARGRLRSTKRDVPVQGWASMSRTWAAMGDGPS